MTFSRCSPCIFLIFLIWICPWIFVFFCVWLWLFLKDLEQWSCLKSPILVFKIFPHSRFRLNIWAFWQDYFMGVVPTVQHWRHRTSSCPLVELSETWQPRENADRPLCSNLCITHGVIVRDSEHTLLQHWVVLILVEDAFWKQLHLRLKIIKPYPKILSWDFTDDLVVKTLHIHCRGHGFTHCLGT